MKLIEATVYKIESYVKFVLIDCDPCGYLMLKKSNKNFINLYNAIHTKQTYLFKCKSPKRLSVHEEYIIIDIQNPNINVIMESIEGFLNITNEFPIIKSHPYEIKFSGRHRRKRLLVTQEQKDKMEPKKTYKVKFSKAFGLNLYEVLEFELTFDYANDLIFNSDEYFCLDY